MSPSSPIRRTVSCGKRASRSMAAAMGRTSLSANSRATAWIIRYSSLSSIFMDCSIPQGTGTRASPRPCPAASTLPDCSHRMLPPISPLLLQEFLELGGQERRHLEEIPHDAVVGDLEDGGLGVLVDRADHLRGAHPRQVLDGARD